jgi:salicylate hydroxylase
MSAPHNSSPVSGFNIDISRSALRADPDLAPFLDQSNFYLGPSQNIVAVNTPDKDDTFNVFFGSRQESTEKGNWYERADVQEIKEKFGSFEPRIQKLLDLTDPDHCYIWHLFDVPSLSTWISHEGSTVILGDSAHAMLPYVGHVSLFECLYPSITKLGCFIRH